MTLAMFVEINLGILFKYGTAINGIGLTVSTIHSVWAECQNVTETSRLEESDSTFNISLGCREELTDLNKQERGIM